MDKLIRAHFGVTDELYLSLGEAKIPVDGFQAVVPVIMLLSEYQNSAQLGLMYGAKIKTSATIRLIGDFAVLAGCGVALYSLIGPDASGILTPIGYSAIGAGLLTFGIGLAVRSDAYRYLLDGVSAYNSAVIGGFQSQ